MANQKFKVINAEGHSVSLLTETQITLPSIQIGFPAIVSSPHTLYSSSQEQPSILAKPSTSTKKHACKVPHCGRAFTTSGHLARHHRIHTGEKNFSCLLPQCNSKFSRQDNMMQHFRTHFLPKSNGNYKLRKTIPPLFPSITSHYNQVTTRYPTSLPYSTINSPYYPTTPHPSYNHLK